MSRKCGSEHPITGRRCTYPKGHDREVGPIGQGYEHGVETLAIFWMEDGRAARDGLIKASRQPDDRAILRERAEVAEAALAEALRRVDVERKRGDRWAHAWDGMATVARGLLNERCETCAHPDPEPT